MFTQPAPSPGILQPGSVNNSPSSPPTSSPAHHTSRTGRLRGLSYLRSYTQNHILSRDSHTSNSTPGTPSPSAAASHAPQLGRTATLTRSVTASAATEQQRSRAFNQPSDQNGSRTAVLSTTNELRRVTSQPVGNTSQTNSAVAVPVSTEPSTATNTAEHQTIPNSQPVSTGPEEDSAGHSAEMTRSRSATTGDMPADALPSIRFSAHYDPRSNRQSLSFTPVSRTLPTGKEIIKVGRYSERENHAPVPSNAPSSAPVGFKSKVVSRRHCEFWFENGKWFIKDVKSSSGTFLNHIRLSPPGTESKPFSINDGDIVQLGIDFRGGEEMIFRCVKMRIELNRGWQAKPNTFNMATHKRLRNMTLAASNASHAQDCSICLNAIAPCQSLFVAPCSHTWHFKCIRELLMGPSYPIFSCPNCRAAADLDMDVEEVSDEWQQLDSGPEEANDNPFADNTSQPDAEPDRQGAQSAQSTQSAQSDVPPPPAAAAAAAVAEVEVPQAVSREVEMGDSTVLLNSSPAAGNTTLAQTTSSPVAIPSASRTPTAGTPSNRGTRTPSPTGAPHLANCTEGPLTPRNDAGPWVFDGDAGRASQDISRPGAMNSLDAATNRVGVNTA
ncbi:E3 ubiquitin-protein ligase DMA2 [Apiospora saccharicola]|uniref:E3 ubiquitin-protein ligase DMA2 n=1 Tax=Apiospora saccharicola TaxID=335842 RepID=A0ABR1UFD8_9PEZI